MKKFLVCTSLLLTGCPMSMDATVNWGSNLKMEKTLKIDQKQTKAQTEAGTTIVEDIISVIPLMSPAPTPTPPPPPKIKSITIELEPKEVPEIPIYTKQPYLPRAKKAKPCIPRTCPQ